MPAAAPITSRFHGLTILRFGAALWVVLFHLQSRLQPTLPDWVDRLFNNGAFAMVLFFVLSGVVLTSGYHGIRTGADIRHFYLARLARIYPTYAVVHVLALLWFSPQEAGWLAWGYNNLLSVLALQAWFPHALGHSVHAGSWTISVEFFFYALFPALLPALVWARTRFGGWGLIAGFALLSALFGFTNIVYRNQSTFMYYVMPIHRLPEFLLGIMLGLAVLEPPRMPRLALPNLLASGATVAGLICLVRLGPPPFWISANYLMVPALAWLLFSCVRAEQVFRPDWKSLPLRILIYLGESSYCLFLGHLLPLMVLETPAGRAWKTKMLQHNLAVEVMIVLTVCSLAIAVVLHELVEKPARRRLLHRWGGRPAPACSGGRNETGNENPSIRQVASTTLMMTGVARSRRINVKPCLSPSNETDGRESPRVSREE